MNSTKYKFTHTDYLNKKCTHREYYSQFVTPYIKRLVEDRFTRERLVSSRDPHLNNIPLTEWDNCAIGSKHFLLIPSEIDGPYADPALAGKKMWSLSNGVCILKEAARQIIEEAASAKSDLFSEIKSAGIPYSNHESDLYFKDTPESRAILDRYEVIKANATRFTNDAPPHKGEIWWDAPFAFLPFWEAKQRRA